MATHMNLDWGNSSRVEWLIDFKDMDCTEGPFSTCIKWLHHAVGIKL